MSIHPTYHHYGTHPAQYVEVWQPAGLSLGTVVFIHGGYWREHLDCSLMHPLVADFVAKQWQVLNLEYRRGVHGWAALRQDIDTALAWVRDTRHEKQTIALIGHSVGGQLALLAATAHESVVALAPVTDIARSQQEGLGEAAVQEFFGTAPRMQATVYPASLSLGTGASGGAALTHRPRCQ